MSPTDNANAPRIIDTLSVTTPSDREIEIVRDFNAPRALVWDAYTKPELLRRWLGCMPGWSWDVCEVDLRVGGKYRWSWNGPDNQQLGITGIYREVEPVERIVNSERFEQAWYPGEAVNTLMLEEQGGRTTVTTRLRFETKEARDGALQSGMTRGMARGWELLDELLASKVTA